MSEPQRFLYQTRVGFGLAIAGEGESSGEGSAAAGDASSALRFWSEDALSLIREGSGYWRYLALPGEPERTRFLTRYDYTTRLGGLGRLVDALAFRPLIGWATAWSFDRLRLWIERGTAPEASLRSAVAYHACRIALGLVWLYHGVVPKLLFPGSGELELLQATPPFARGGTLHALSAPALTGIGVLEILLGLALLLRGRHRLLLLAQVVLLPLLALAAVVARPDTATWPFNPVSLTLALLALGLSALALEPLVPFASRCRRRPVKSEEERG